MENNTFIETFNFQVIPKKYIIERNTPDKSTKNTNSFSDIINREISQKSKTDNNQITHEKSQRLEDEVISKPINELENTKELNKEIKTEKEKDEKDNESLEKEIVGILDNENLEINQLVETLEEIVERLTKELMEANNKTIEEENSENREILTDLSSIKQLIDNLIQYKNIDEDLDYKHVDEIVSDIELILDKLPLTENQDTLSNYLEILKNEVEENMINIVDDEISKEGATNILNQEELNNLVMKEDKENITLEEIEVHGEKGTDEDDKVDLVKLQDNEIKDNNNFNPLKEEINDEFLIESNGLKEEFQQTKLEIQEKNQLEGKNFIQLNRDEIVNEIVEKAKLDITGQQSEIKVKLKPEILGDMTLKIAIEKGIITAKALVESYQVKELIESNLDQLRDELREQGMDIKGFDVSVGKDHSFSQNSYRNEHNMVINRRHRIKLNEDVDSLYLQDTVNSGENKGFNNYSGSIDLMA